MEKGIQRGETQEIPWRTDPGGLRQGTYSKAVKLIPGLQSPVLLKMGGRRPAHEISQHHLSVLKFGLGHYKKALSLQNNLININPHKAGYYNNRGNTLLRLGDFQKAISDFNHAIELDPHKAEFLVNRSNALSCLDEYPEALFDLDEAIKVDANLAIAYANRANVHTPAAEVSVEPTLFQPSFC